LRRHRCGERENNGNKCCFDDVSHVPVSPVWAIVATTRFTASRCAALTAQVLRYNCVAAYWPTNLGAT
jgi:hypothetical protein